MGSCSSCENNISGNDISEIDEGKWIKLYEYLKNDKWYSMQIDVTCKKANITKNELNDIKHKSGKNSESFERYILKIKGVKDHVNIFDFNGITYVGLETRKKDYDRDRKNGTNRIENLIKDGWYDRENES